MKLKINNIIQISACPKFKDICKSRMLRQSQLGTVIAIFLSTLGRQSWAENGIMPLVISNNG